MPQTRAPKALTAGLACLTIGLAAQTACGSSTPTPSAPIAGAQTIPLAIDLPFDRLDVPAHSRPHDPEVPHQIPLAGWRKANRGFATAIPIRVRNHYFSRPNPGMAVTLADGTEVPHRAYANGSRLMWTYDDRTIVLHGLEDAPKDGAITLAYPMARERERALNHHTSGLAPEDFVRTSVQLGPDSRSGLLLPAPSTATWTLTVPPAASLRFRAGLAVPEVSDGPSSDGATLAITLTDAEGEHALHRQPVTDASFARTRVDLSPWAGQQVTLTVATDPGADPTFDYVFLADPVVGTENPGARRMVLVFVDTLRPDHMSAYGYDRDTTPAIAALAAQGARFDEARSIAPWTLPSARTMMTGVHPERFFDAPTLQGTLAKEGWATAMLAGNMYLGPKFGLNRDWGLHSVDLLPHAEDQLDKALAWLDEHDGRDAFLLLHLMDPHLPYKEPASYRNLYAGDAPPALAQRQNGYAKSTIDRARLRTKEDRQYVRDRYDNNIRYADDQLARLFEALTPDDVVMFVSDHGEEFWDHGDFEHGHSLFDELLRVPMILKAPGVPAGTVVEAPTSLLDVTPTLLDLAGLTLDTVDGTSLVPAAAGEKDALASLRDRPQAFGRPLYGNERWGSLLHDKKYATIMAKDMVFDLASDPKERDDLLPNQPGLRETMHDVMGDALDREVRAAYRVAALYTRNQPTEDFQITVTVPGGIDASWVGQDPTSHSMAVIDWTPGSDTVTATWPPPYKGSRTVWIVPTKPMAEVTHQLGVTVGKGADAETFPIDPTKPATFPDKPEVLLKERTNERGWELGFGFTPVPRDEDADLEGYDAETAGALKAMGYLVGDEDDGTPAPSDDRDDDGAKPDGEAPKRP